MAATEVIYYREGDGTVPLVEWFDRIPEKAVQKCQVRLQRLEELGHELRRPEADFLRDGIHELRASHQGVHYRMLYFFHGRHAVVVSHGLVKEQIVPPKAIDLAIARKAQFELNAKKHSFRPGG